MIYNYYNGALGDHEGLDEKLFESALDQWTERPQLGGGYNKRLLKLYDALIWTRVENTIDELEQIKSSIKERDEGRENDNYYSRLLLPTTNDDLLIRLNDIEEDIKNWKYTGKIYRVIDCKKDRIEYHQLITSWVNDPEVFEQFNHLCKKHKYSFLIGDTGDDWAFDVNKYRKHTNNRHQYTEYESEIIFPIDKKCIVDVFYGTLEEFYEYIK